MASEWYFEWYVISAHYIVGCRGRGWWRTWSTTWRQDREGWQASVTEAEGPGPYSSRNYSSDQSIGGNGNGKHESTHTVNGYQTSIKSTPRMGQHVSQLLCDMGIYQIYTKKAVKYNLTLTLNTQIWYFMEKHCNLVLSILIFNVK